MCMQKPIDLKTKHFSKRYTERLQYGLSIYNLALCNTICK